MEVDIKIKIKFGKNWQVGIHKDAFKRRLDFEIWHYDGFKAWDLTILKVTFYVMYEKIKYE